MITIDLNDSPDFQKLLQLYQQLTAKVDSILSQLSEWVDEQEAQKITCLSRGTLWRERKKPGSLIVWKSDHGVRYLRASLIDHNNRRIVGGK